MQQNNYRGGWVTLEFILLMPVFATLLFILVFIGSAIFTKLQLGYLSQAAANRATQSDPPDCGAAQSLISSSYPGAQTSCDGDEFTLQVHTSFIYSLPIAGLPVLKKDLKATALSARIQKRM